MIRVLNLSSTCTVHTLWRFVRLCCLVVTSLAESSVFDETVVHVTTCISGHSLTNQWVRSITQYAVAGEKQLVIFMLVGLAEKNGAYCVTKTSGIDSLHVRMYGTMHVRIDRPLSSRRALLMWSTWGHCFPPKSLEREVSNYPILQLSSRTHSISPCTLSLFTASHSFIYYHINYMIVSFYKFHLGLLLLLLLLCCGIAICVSVAGLYWSILSFFLAIVHHVLFTSSPFIMMVFNFNRYGVTIQYEFGKEAVRSANGCFPCKWKLSILWWLNEKEWWELIISEIRHRIWRPKWSCKHIWRQCPFCRNMYVYATLPWSRL